MTTTITKAGAIYKYIADASLKNSGVPYEKRVELLGSNDFDLIEAESGAKPYIEAGCEVLIEAFERLEIYPPQDFADVVLWSQSPLEDLMSFRRKILIGGDDPGYIPDGTEYFGKFPNETKGEISCRFLEKLHDTWVAAHEPLYFDMARERMRYQFLPAPLIGFEAVMEFSGFLDPILIALSIPVERQYIRQAYIGTRKRYAEAHGITNRESLMAHIRHLDYAPPSQAVRISMEYPCTAEALTCQVIEFCGEPSKW